MQRSTPGGSKAAAPMGLARYGSAPGSLLTSIADSVVAAGGYSAGVGSEGTMSWFFPGESSSCLSAESSCKASAAAGTDLEPYQGKEGGGALGEIPEADPTAAKEGVSGSLSLMRHSSSPAGFFSNLMVDNGFSVTRGMGTYSQAGLDGVHAMASRRLNSQLSFSGQDSLSQISEIPDIGESIGGPKSSDEVAGQSYISSNFPVASWDDTNSIVFSAPLGRQVKDSNGDIITCFVNIESQFSLPKTSLERATVEKYLQIHQDSAPFKIRAKRGYATHPRSIAERERRMRISEKLRKLQELFLTWRSKQTQQTCWIWQSNILRGCRTRFRSLMRSGQTAHAKQARGDLTVQDHVCVHNA